jgi:hypothetical protein
MCPIGQKRQSHYELMLTLLDSFIAVRQCISEHAEVCCARGASHIRVECGSLQSLGAIYCCAFAFLAPLKSENRVIAARIRNAVVNENRSLSVTRRLQPVLF